jgi:hypothetical protein
METKRRMNIRPISNVVIRKSSVAPCMIPSTIRSAPTNRACSREFFSKLPKSYINPQSKHINIRESSDNITEAISSHTDTACTSSSISVCSANEKRSCQLGPMPLAVLKKPSIDDEWQPEISPHHLQIVKLTKIGDFTSSSMRQLPADHEATVIAPMNQKAKWSKKPRQSYDSHTPNALQKILTLKLTSPIQVNHTSYLQFHAKAASTKQHSSLRNMSTYFMFNGGCNKLSLANNPEKKVQFAANSILHIYRQTKDSS